MREVYKKIDEKLWISLFPWVAKGLTERELNARCVELCKEVGFQGLSFDLSQHTARVELTHTT